MIVHLGRIGTVDVFFSDNKRLIIHENDWNRGP